MRIKTIVRCHLTLVIMAVINKPTNNKCWRDCGEKGTLMHYWWDCILVLPLWKTVWNFLKKLKIELPCDPVKQLLGIYPKKSKTLILKDIHTPMSIAALFTIAKIWKQPKWPSIDEWIKKKWYIYTVEYYLAIKKNEILPSETT